ncbi:MAG: ferrous iron transport protein B [Candidatus Omnitrophica bacterium]|nr:ferrous iron transport protein B [Candidatus Omnitrophota bacterium]
MNEKAREILVAVAGQPNSGKSTIFNLLTGARQHVANYPGVTVEKKIGSFRSNGDKVVVVDLPGTYSLTSYTQEERIARDFLLLERPEVVVDIVDASNLERNLYLTFQLIEMGLPLVLDLNMVDVAKRRGFEINTEELSRQLGIPVAPTVGNKSRGKDELRQTIHSTYKNKQNFTPIRLNYGETLESVLKSLEEELSQDPRLMEHYSSRWLAVRLMENDSEVQRLVRQQSQRGEDILSKVEQEREYFIGEHKKAPEKLIAQQRYQAAGKIVENCVKRVKVIPTTLTDRIDKVVCNRFFGPVILATTIYGMYQLAIVHGYKLTEYTWPLLAAFRNFVASMLPSEGFVYDPILRAMPLGVIDGVIAVLNYVPIFVILFALIAILEDTGYMARMAFILDRVFRYFGLHGHSVLPLILGGVCVGGCAIPGVMACRGIKDEKARMATILIVPLMNCMAKIPLYVLLIGMFFARQKALMMFFISTITIIIALAVAKILNLTVLRKKESAPFILEMPAYHLPTFSGVMHRCIERVWLFVKKIISVVIIVAAIVYVLISYPGLNKERSAYYEIQSSQAIQTFHEKIGDNNSYTKLVAGAQLMEFTTYWDEYKKAKMGAKTKQTKEAIDQKFYNKKPEFFKIVKRGKYELEGKKIVDKDAARVEKAYKKLSKTRKKFRRERREETITLSYLGKTGHFLEPVTKFAGFNWRVNIALLSSFAAKESSVATLGSIYQSSPEDKEVRLEERIKEKEPGWTPLHALGIILFMAMYPPCIPTLLMVKLETASLKWMFFATLYPIVLGFIMVVLIFTGGNLLGLSGLQAMVAFYILAIAVTTVMAFIKRKPELA